MPELEEFFHYRNVDVSTIKELARRWHPAVLDADARQGDGAPGPGRHQESIAELVHYRDTLFPPSAPSSVAIT